MAYLRLEEAEAVEEAEAESEAALDALADTLRALRAEPPGMAHLLSVCAQQLSAAQRLLRSLEVELSAARLPSAEAARREAAAAAQRARLAALSRTLDFERKAWQREALLRGRRRRRAAGGPRDSHARADPRARRGGAAGVAARERLGRLRATAGAMQAQMDMAERELRTFVSTALGDNVTLALLVLIALGLVGISVFRVSEIDYSRRSEAADAAASAGHKHIGWQTLSHIVSPLKE
ncbi:hypothetical protein AB1Y20_023453 [Prymnesium parvum]|uniref:Uncharacterized protein n=1 Tax=Prymnesium parvum TaxID=97485 RepID=A0AB34JGA6_PRYPA